VVIGRKGVFMFVKNS